MALIGRDDGAGAMVRDAFAELGNLFDALSTSDEVRVVVLRGAGKQFSTGGNVRAMADRAPRATTPTGSPMGLHQLPQADVPQPAGGRPARLACVNGDAVGAGTTLALHCDIVLAAEEAKFGDPHVRRGLVASAGPGIWSLMTSLNLAKEYLLTGDLLSAQEAHRIGLVNHLYAAGRPRGRGQPALADGWPKVPRWPSSGRSGCSIAAPTVR